MKRRKKVHQKKIYHGNFTKLSKFSNKRGIKEKCAINFALTQITDGRSEKKLYSSKWK